MQYLIDLRGRHRRTLAECVFRFCTGPGGYNTRPGDDVPNVHYAARINSAGDYRRALFGGQGRTTGVASVDTGEILLANSDGELDELLDYAFDGYDVTVSALADLRASYGSRTVVFRATVAQVEVIWDEVRLRIRSRLALLDKPIQEDTYKGTTIAGGMNEAEGDANLKDAPRVLLYGSALLVEPVLLNRFDQIYGVGQRLDGLVEVRDRGAKLPSSGQDYPDLTTLRAAAVPDGSYSTCLALGLVRLDTEPEGTLTVRAIEGATAADRTAGQVVRRILVERAKLVPGVDFLEADIAALDALDASEVQYWTGTNSGNMLAAIGEILDSVNAWIAPDRLGVFRIGRFGEPATTARRTFSEIEVIEENGTGLQRLATGDSGGGIPASAITVQHSQIFVVIDKGNLSGVAKETDPDFVEFAGKQWRQEEVKLTAIETLHRLSKPLSFTTLLVSAIAAKTRATLLTALYGVQRDRYDVPVPSRYAVGLDLGDTVQLRLKRFGLSTGRNFVIVGERSDLGGGVTTLDLWG